MNPGGNILGLKVLESALKAFDHKTSLKCFNSDISRKKYHNMDLSVVSGSLRLLFLTFYLP